MGSDSTRKKLSFGNVFWVVFFGFFALMYWIDGLETKEDYNIEELFDQSFDEETDSQDRIFRRQSDQFKSKNCDPIEKAFIWNDLHGNSHELKFSICAEDYDSSRAYRSNAVAWGSFLYDQLYQKDVDGLGNMVDAFRYLKRSKSLTKGELLEAVVTMVQSIPYTYVMSGYSCGTRSYPEAFCAPRVEPAGCCDNIKPWGVFSPIEFMVQETGDCDTRSLLCFSILHELGFDVAVVNSDKELHSMLGVHLPFIPGNGFYGTDPLGLKKYYLWETTAMGYHLGDNYFAESDDWIVEYN